MPRAKRAKKRTSKKRATRTKARAIWKGRITFGTVDLPVKLYSAVVDRSIRFRLLDAKRKEPVNQEMVHPETGEVVDYADVRKAYATDRGQLVILDDDELDEAEPRESRDIEITRFVPVGKITHPWYERPYWLGPDEDSSAKYFALAEALGQEELEGVARWVMRKKEYVGSLRREGDHLMLISLRHAAEVIPASSLEPPGGRELSKRELDMAKQLVRALEGEFDVAAFKDEYRERVLDLVDAKTKGKVVRFPKARAKKTDDDALTSALERSLSAARKKSA